MRATYLQFRSPKEKTPSAYDTSVTYDGRRILQSKKRNSSGPKDRRFSQYEIEAKRTGYRLGPGSYRPDNLNIGESRVIGTHLYKKKHANNDLSNNAYYYIGDSVVFDPYYLKGKQDRKIGIETSKDVTQVIKKRRPRSAALQKKDSELSWKSSKERMSPVKRTRPSSANRFVRSPYLSKIVPDKQ